MYNNYTPLSHVCLENALSLASREFDPKRFLAEYHKATSFADLKKGYSNLIDAVDQRNETMKLLVKSHFDRFVGAKSTVDAIYRELKLKNLESSGYGTDEFHKALEESSKVAKELFHPIIERRIRADKIRSTASLLDRYKSFFNLPANLEESLKKGRFDQAVKEYKKGRAVLQAVKSQVLESSPETVLSSQKKLWEGVLKVFEKVWSRVESSVKELKSKLYNDLSDMKLTTDVHESYLSHLIDLDIADNEDPVWYYIDCRIKWITQSVKTSYENRSQSLYCIVREFARMSKERDSNYRDCLDKNDSEQRKSLDKHYHDLKSVKLQKKLFAQDSKEFDALFSNEIETRFWKSLLSMFAKVADIMSLHLPDFWNLCKDYIDGKFKKSSQVSGKLKSVKCIDAYSVLVEEVSKMFSDPFALLKQESENKPMINVSGDADLDEFLTDPKAWTAFYSLIKEQVVGACFYLPRIIILMSDCNFTVSKYLRAAVSPAIKAPQIHSLQNVFEETQKLILNFVSAGSVKCSAELYIYEDNVPISQLSRWSIEKRILSRGTVSVRMLSHLQFLCIKTLFQIATLSAGDSVGVFKNSLPSKTLNLLRTNFFQSIYVYLDGIRYLAFEDGVSESINDQHVDARYLLALENVNVLLNLLSSCWFSYFETMFECKLKPAEIENFESICKSLENSIFGAYIGNKKAKINDIVAKSCFQGGYNWKRNSVPSELHPHVNVILYELVNLQSIFQKWLQCDDTADSDQQLRTRLYLSTLKGVVDILRIAYQKIDIMSPYGGIHALVDIKAILELVTPHSESSVKLNAAAIEKTFRAIIAENVTSYLSCSRNKDDAVKDIGIFFDSQTTVIEDILIRWRFSSELALTCLKG